MYLLIDECCPKCLVRYAANEGHTAQRSVQVLGLGPAASDREIFRFAQNGLAVLVTENAADFERLAKGQKHAGVIVLPAEPPRVQGTLLRRLLRFMGTSGFGIADRFLEITPAGKIISYRV